MSSAVASIILCPCVCHFWDSVSVKEHPCKSLVFCQRSTSCIEAFQQTLCVCVCVTVCLCECVAAAVHTKEKGRGKEHPVILRAAAGVQTFSLKAQTHSW